jgi:protein-tyrosine phosphatase
VATIWSVGSRERQITFDACFNFRDLGGYETVDGRSVRWGAVFRSGSLHRMTTEDVEIASRLGIRTVIDLRSTAELDRSGSYAGGSDVTFHHAPLFENDDLPFKWAEIDTPAPPPGEDYVAIADKGAQSLAAAFRAIAEGDHAVVFHCAAGKDRTGILTALLFSCLGVPDHSIFGDYQLSDLSIVPFAKWAEVHAPDEAAESAARPTWLVHSSISTMQGFFDSLRCRDGSIENFLNGAGVERWGDTNPSQATPRRLTETETVDLSASLREVAHTRRDRPWPDFCAS